MTTGADIDFHWHEVAALAQLDPDFPIGVEVEGQRIGLFLLGDAVHAIEDVCPHAYALLSQGFQEDGVIECPLHAARFDIASGKCLTEIGQRDLQCFPVRVQQGRVQLRLQPQAKGAA
jgi:nitrite reductase/ring-hydroxylating ferredoxin subunit